MLIVSVDLVAMYIDDLIDDLIVIHTPITS